MVNQNFVYQGCPLEDFPPFPEFSQDSIMQLSSKLLKEMIRKTFFAQSPDETRQVLNGLLLEQDNGKVKMVGTDGHRLAIIRRDLGNGSKRRKIESPYSQKGFGGGNEAY